jgi:hypothetical protein
LNGSIRFIQERLFLRLEAWSLADLVRDRYSVWMLWGDTS